MTRTVEEEQGEWWGITTARDSDPGKIIMIIKLWGGGSEDIHRLTCKWQPGRYHRINLGSKHRNLQSRKRISQEDRMKSKKVKSSRRWKKSQQQEDLGSIVQLPDLIFVFLDSRRETLTLVEEQR